MRPELRNKMAHPNALPPFERLLDGLRLTSQLKIIISNTTITMNIGIS